MWFHTGHIVDWFVICNLGNLFATGKKRAFLCRLPLFMSCHNKYKEQTGLPDPREEVNPINKECSPGGPEGAKQERMVEENQYMQWAEVSYAPYWGEIISEVAFFCTSWLKCIYETMIKTWNKLTVYKLLESACHKSERTDAASASLYSYPRDSNLRAAYKKLQKNFSISFFLY